MAGIVCVCARARVRVCVCVRFVFWFSLSLLEVLVKPYCVEKSHLSLMIRSQSFRKPARSVSLCRLLEHQFVGWGQENSKVNRISLLPVLAKLHLWSDITRTTSLLPAQQ